jgi:hypothetical protein
MYYYSVAMATDTDKKPLAAPPYISFKTFINLLERLQQTRLPPRIDRSYLTGLSGGYQTQVIAALRWLDLIGEEGDVTGSLTALAQSPDARPRLIGELLRSHYPAVFALSSQNGTQGQLEEQFRNYGISGSTLRSAIAFFLNASRYAEIPVSPHFKVPQGRGSNGKTTARRPTKATKRGANDTSAPSLSPDPSADMRTRYLDMLLKKAESQEEMDSGLLDRIETLLGYETEPKK